MKIIFFHKNGIYVFKVPLIDINTLEVKYMKHILQIVILSTFIIIYRKLNENNE